MSQVIRRYEIRRRRARRSALKKWKQRLAKASGPKEQQKILSKVRKIAGALHLREWTQQASSRQGKRAA